MHLFIHDTHLHIMGSRKAALSAPNFSQIIQAQGLDSAQLIALPENALIQLAQEDQIYELILEIEKTASFAPRNMFVSVEDKKVVRKFLQRKIQTIRAGGGLVIHKNKYLLIFRRGKWDLPKGKIDPGETIAQAAVREVQEECNLPVEIIHKITNTWHTYLLQGKLAFKKTTWYLMRTDNPKSIRPQIEEDIEQIIFMDTQQKNEALRNSYRSIEFVFEKHQTIQAGQQKV